MTLYNRFKIEDFTLRDYLALERTILSNERTLLAYLRTGITLLVAGITGTQLLPQEYLVLCIGAAILGLLASITGIWRFCVIRNRLNHASPDATADVTAKHVSESGFEDANEAP